MSFGRLERGRAPPLLSDINVTPLVDVMLVLVVVFIITAPLLAGAIRLDLPRAEGTQPGVPPAIVTVSIDRKGQVFFDNRPVTAAQLAAALQAAARAHPETEIQLRADQTVPYGRVVEVMGQAQQAGLRRIGFAAEGATPKTPAVAP